MQDSRFIRACRNLPTDQTPIWFMRQAGRYMANYRAIRAKYSMLEVIKTPELSAEITLQPIERFGFDAAIIFSDILPPLVGMGLNLDYIKGTGPCIDNPIRSVADIDKLSIVPAEESMGGTLAAIGLVSAELTVPLIGFCGAPFTLASYAIEGGSSKVFAHTKTLMYSDPAAWDCLMEKLVAVQADYLIKQAQAGASALQIFDSWAGMALSRADYVRYIQPHNTKLLALVKAQTDVPLINFSTGTGGYLNEVAACGGDVVGVDWRVDLGEAWDGIGRNTPIMGNLDPVALLAPWEQLRPRIDHILAQTAGQTGHIFNLGHGILPPTPHDNVERTVAYVREKTALAA